MLINDLKATIFDKNTIIFPKVGQAVHTNKKRILVMKSAIDNNIMALSVDEPASLLSDYLFEYFLAFVNLTDIALSADPPSISASNLNEVKIPLPPLEVQQQIVSECEVVDKEMEQARQAIEQAKTEIEKTANGVSAPMKKLSEVTSKIGSGATPRGGESSYKETGISLIRSQNIYDDGFKEKGLAFIDKEQARLLKNVTVEANDVLLNITGASVARCSVVESRYLPARVNQHVAIIRPTETLNAQYLHQILVSSRIKEDLLNIAKSSSTREAITKTQLEEFKIPLPTLQIQKELVAKIQTHKTIITQAKQVLGNSSERKRDILKKYL